MTAATMPLTDTPVAPPTRTVWTPNVLVCVPRAIATDYWALPWADLMAAAERGCDPSRDRVEHEPAL
jgi:hypothetical protein